MAFGPGVACGPGVAVGPGMAVGPVACIGADEATAGLVPAACAGAPAAVTARALSGTARGIGRAGWTPALGCCGRAAASALTRCSSSAARSGARPAHSRRRLSSRACEKKSSDRIAIPSSAANAAMAPILVNELESESASSVDIMNPESV
jgi:hypothetical protein